ncbi:MAG: hypothetical protein KAS32_13275 [Candidatus Peribacteraceae bacterium]|nr:hypothetical protein [Candidatus Peribacteraceae bacterium]
MKETLMMIEKIKEYAKSRHDSLMAQSEGIYNGLKLELDSLKESLFYGVDIGNLQKKIDALWEDRQDSECDCGSQCEKCSLLSLNVRVAKALGWIDFKEYPPHTGEYWAGWFGVSVKPMPDNLNQCGRSQVPAYDTDLMLAMGALYEYATKISETWNIWKNGDYLAIQIADKTHYEGWRDSLPTAICEAIVKHAEGK